jgi:hypothetical protein
MDRPSETEGPITQLHRQEKHHATAVYAETKTEYVRFGHGIHANRFAQSY